MKLVVLAALPLFLAACSSEPGPKSPPANDPWEGYGLDGQTAEGDEPRPEESRRPPDDPIEPLDPFPAEPAPPVEEIPRIDPTPTRPGRRFDQTLTITQAGGTQSIYSTIELQNDLVRQDDFADEERTAPLSSKIHRAGGTLLLDHGQRKQSFSPSAFDEINDPSVVYFFQDLKGQKKWQKNRSATYQGVQCDIYEKPAPARLQQTDVLWVTTEPPGFLLRYSSKNLLGIETLLTRSLPEEVDIDPARFEAPEDYAR